MRASALALLLSKAIEARYPVLVVGAPGIGKTDIVTQASAMAGADLLLSHPVVADPTDAKGLPWAEAGATEARFLPFGDLAQALHATKPLVWFLDDLGQASPAVQASYMQLLLARKINGHELPDVVTFVAATNRRSDRAGVSGILEPVKSRFATIVQLDPDENDWTDWAIANGMPPELIAFIRLRPEILHKFEASADMKNSPSPRTWASVAKLFALDLPIDVMHAAFEGAVGTGAAAEFIGFLELYRDLPSTDEVFLNPLKAPVPDNASALYAISTALGNAVTANNFDRLTQYAERMPQEFGVLCIRDALKRNRAIARTKAWLKYVNGPIGQAVMGSGI